MAWRQPVAVASADLRQSPRPSMWSWLYLLSDSDGGGRVTLTPYRAMDAAYHESARSRKPGQVQIRVGTMGRIGAVCPVRMSGRIPRIQRRGQCCRMQCTVAGAGRDGRAVAVAHRIRRPDAAYRHLRGSGARRESDIRCATGALVRRAGRQSTAPVRMPRRATRTGTCTSNCACPARAVVSNCIGATVPTAAIRWTART